MNIAVTGTQMKIEELRARLSSACNIIEFKPGDSAPAADLLVDLDFDAHPGEIDKLLQAKTPLLLGAVKVQLAAVFAVLGKKPGVPVFGLNSLPGFINRPKLEVSAYNKEEKSILEQFAQQSGLALKWVEDRVGMVSPRILFMIINEAYYTVQEGTANKKDIDIAMKLGTAYPFGPFEFVERIGISPIYETLLALHQDTGEERYKVCPLLKTEYLRHQASGVRELTVDS